MVGKKIVLFLFCFSILCLNAQPNKVFKVISFYTAKSDLAHISFVKEANTWLSAMAKQYGFVYDSTNDWKKLTTDFLSNYQVVIFLDTRPDSLPQRNAFQEYMEKGGGWIGFHFAGFSLTPSSYPQNWDWYHETFLGSGEYAGNIWRPSSAFLMVEDSTQPFVRNLPKLFKSSPNEWYSWKNDLRQNPAIKILLSIDSASFPLGHGPKPYEIWHSGYFPVAWTNTKYRMVYFNMGHNDMDYGDTNKDLSHTFGNKVQDRLIVNSILWLGRNQQ